MSRQAVYKTHFTSKADLLLELVRHVHVAEQIDEVTRPVSEAASGPAALEETIAAIVKIEAKVHDIAWVLSAAAASDPGAAAAWRDRMEVKRATLRAALRRTQAEGRLRSEWTLEEVVDVLAAVASVETYHELVVVRGWKPAALIEKLQELARTFVAEPKGRATKRRERREPPTKRARAKTR